MKKRIFFFMFIATILLMSQFVSAESNEKYALPVKVGCIYEFHHTAENLLKTNESPITPTYYEFNQYEIRRYNNILQIGIDSSHYVSVYGYKFILTNDEIWYISSKREVCSFAYKLIDYENVKAYEIPNRLIALHGSADICEEDYMFESEHEDMRILGKTKVTMYDIPYTIVISKNEVTSYSENHVFHDMLVFPFEIKEIAFAGGGAKEFSFFGKDGTVGIISITEEGLNYYISGNNATGLLLKKLGDSIKVETGENWVVYYNEERNLVASNGEMSFVFSDCEWEKYQYEDYYGIRKGYKNLAMVYHSVDYYMYLRSPVEAFVNECDF